MFKYHEIRQINVELSSKCNAACAMCPRNNMGGYELPWLDKTEISLAQFAQIFPPEFLAKLHSVTFCGNYGDPGTCTDLLEIVRYIRRSGGAGIRMHTNGSLRNPEFWSQIGSAMGPIDTVIWSVDGLEDTNHLYRRNTVWSKIMENARAFIAAGGSATWEFLIFAHNEHQIEEARALSQKLGFAHFIPKKAFGFESQGRGLSAKAVHQRNGDFDYFIYAPSDDHKNITARIAEQDEAAPQEQPNPVPKQTFVEWFRRDKDTFDERVRSGLFDHLDGYEIDCKAIEKKEIYLDAAGNVHPCCFLGHVSQDSSDIENMQYYRFFEEEIGWENANALKRGLEAVVNSDYFAKIEATWSLPSHRDGKIATCTRMCRTQHNPFDSLYESVRSK